MKSKTRPPVRRRVAREPFILFIGDLHAGSTVALSPLGQIWSANQLALHDAWEHLLHRVKLETRACDLLLMLGGDLVDGPRHHGTWETWGTPKEQRDGAVSLLLPLANRAKSIHAIIGTEAHAGPKGEDDTTVAQELGARTAQYVWEMTIGGKSLLWTHHGVRVPRDPWNATNAEHAMAKRIHQASLRTGKRPPDLAVFHDAHFSPSPLTAYGVTVAVCPCWQLNTSYGYKLAPEHAPDNGVLAWWPKQNRLERWLYLIKDGRFEAQNPDQAHS